METAPQAEQTSGVKIPCWYDNAPKLNTPSVPLTSDLDTDVCIIGAGLAGLSIAYFLIKQGQRVVIIEDGEVCSGETGRTTAHLMWWIDDHVSEIIKYFGKDAAKLHVESHRTAIDMIERISKEEGIDCQFKRLPGYLISAKPLDKQKDQPDKDLQDELTSVAKELGYHEVHVADRAPFAKESGKCLVYPRHGQFHPLAYCYGLADKITEYGGKIFTKTRVAEWKDGDKPYAKSKSGFTVTCKKLVMATNSPLQLLTTIAKLEPNRSYAVAGKVPKGKYEPCLIWDDQENYHYCRYTPLDETHELLIVGGEDHMTGAEVDYEQRFLNLEAWTKERWPDVEFTHRWSGQVQEPTDLMAYIGLDPGSKNTYICTGDSGQGMTHCTIAGRLISDLILDIPNPWKALYDPKRLAMKAIPETGMHLVEANLQFKDYFQGGDVTDIEDIVKGDGAIICKGIHRYAVYKDEDGQIHSYSAVCPHLKGSVRWNDAEKSWDCPIHGSRFDRFGKTVNGPAKTDLSKVDYHKVLCSK